MKLEELLLGKDSPLTEEQKDELQEEYRNITSKLYGDITKLDKEKAKLLEKIGRMEKSFEGLRDKTIGALLSVLALIEHTKFGMTHREKNFYMQAIGKYIENIVDDIRENEKSADYIPF